MSGRRQEELTPEERKGAIACAMRNSRDICPAPYRRPYPKNAALKRVEEGARVGKTLISYRCSCGWHHVCDLPHPLILRIPAEAVRAVYVPPTLDNDDPV